MTASFITCQDSQVAIFNHLDNDGDPLPADPLFTESAHLDVEVLAHLSHCKECQHYQKELSALMSGLKDYDVQGGSHLIMTSQKMDQLADKVWNRLLHETDLDSLSDSKEASVIRFASNKPARSKAWWSQPVAPMAAAAALVVMAGFSYLQFGNFSQSLGLQSVYVSPDYELDGQKLVYDSADQILDPTWIEDSGNNSSDSSTSSMGQVSNLSSTHNAQLSMSQLKTASVLLTDDESDPLKQFVGF